MQDFSAGRGRRTRALGAAAALLAAALAGPAGAVELFEDRVEIHGYYEAQIRSIVRDFDFSDDWDLTQWWNVLSLEFEWAAAPDGIGPFDTVNVFSRVEVRYDCVWTRGCAIFPSVDAYGDRIRKLPKRLSDARRSGYQGTNYMGDIRHYYDVPFTDVNQTPDRARLRPSGERMPLEFFQTTIGAPFFGSSSYGLDGIPQTEDDPPFFYFEQMLRPHCDQWSLRQRPEGDENGAGAADILILDPACNYDTIGAAADKPNPFRAADFNPLIGGGGALALPYRPAPRLDWESRAPLAAGARGIYYPNFRLQQLLDEDELEPFPTKLRRSELAWNRGLSQQEQKELKELYVDLEMFDSRLWLRIGYQTIVWGKTELFRNQDQFNPQDVALGSLTSLEESRISLWAVRAVWSFYDVGPLNDVRLELAFNFDQFEPNDLGTCGEPYTVIAACALSVGQIAHGYFGIGLAGEIRPPDPWNDVEGVEAGLRLEWRWDRFSFAITDFYGYQDFPYVDTVFSYSRNVDPISGRPRHTMTQRPCLEEGDSGCLDADHAIDQHHANQQLFAMICANTVGIVPTLDPNACFANIFNSQVTVPDANPAPRVVVALNVIAQGDLDPTPFTQGGDVFAALAEFPADGSVQAAIAARHHLGLNKVTVNLNRDVNDGPVDYPAGHPLLDEADFATSVDLFYTALGASLSDKLTDFQEALLGCGPFYRTSCDLDGVDLLNAEASAVYQAFPNVEGTFDPDPTRHWDTTDRDRAQPGTVGFEGGPLCTRRVGDRTFVLPGCRGPGDPGYDPRIDGTTTNVAHPFTGQPFRNELGGVSWNLLMGLVGLSLPGRDFGDFEGPRHAPDRSEFDANDPFRRGGCSFREPQWCSAVTAFLGLSGVRRNDVRAGGNGRFGRRDFVWQSGGTGVLRYDKANILGFSMDFAEDVTKSNWGVEFTWVEDIHLADNDAFDGHSETDAFRLTISVDRPTFVNFLNANRTFFFNTQWFFEYQDDYGRGFLNDGPLDIFGVFAVSTGYFQDRLLPSIVVVYFVRNNSFAVLPEVSYRFSENFSATFGIAAFAGRDQLRRAPINDLAIVTDSFGRNAYRTSVQNGLAVIRERDEIFLRIKYTF